MRKWIIHDKVVEVTLDQFNELIEIVADARIDSEEDPDDKPFTDVIVKMNNEEPLNDYNISIIKEGIEQRQQFYQECIDDLANLSRLLD